VLPLAEDPNLASTKALLKRQGFYSINGGILITLASKRQSASDQLSMRTLIPNARMTVVEGPSHETYVDEPEECITAFLKFIRSVG
jgi:pimeloyl-ACP methyl ester carboxylesterase